MTFISGRRCFFFMDKPVGGLTREGFSVFASPAEKKFPWVKHRFPPLVLPAMMGWMGFTSWGSVPIKNDLGTPVFVTAGVQIPVHESFQRSRLRRGPPSHKGVIIIAVVSYPPC